MMIGYARVSTQDQNLELQREALTKTGCQKVFEDKVSGTRADRPGLAKALEILREGDTLVVWKLDRLGCSVKHLVDLVGEPHKQSPVQEPDRCHRHRHAIWRVLLSRHGQSRRNGARGDC